MFKDIPYLLKLIVRTALNLSLALVMAIALYLLCAILLTFIPANNSAKQPATGIEIYIKSNGVHTDLILPTNNKFYQWEEKIHPEDFGLVSTEDTWTAFGWGDKGFYLHTPEWADLKFSTAMDAVLPTVGESAMHITIYENAPVENTRTKKIILTDEQYLVLCDYIYQSFVKNEEEDFILISGYHYSSVNDNFYEAEGDYNFLKTCNQWTNQGLKKAGVRTAFWAPFDKCIFYYF
ncbi:MAG TPA: TIGR02117 family protein [Cytophagaceae bacterium]|nr:TIGR02117 family protein [Cytophagaceae bacterium]